MLLVRSHENTFGIWNGESQKTMCCGSRATVTTVMTVMMVMMVMTVTMGMMATWQEVSASAVADDTSQGPELMGRDKPSEG